MNAYMAALSTASNEISAHMVRAFKNVRKSPPSVLYHYTNADGLLGILRNRSLWASDVRAVNDMHEIKYSLNLLKELVKHKSVSSNIGQLVEFFDAISLFIDGWFRAYSVSFSELGDDLPQWRAYAGGVGGYSIGFDLQAAKFHAFISRSPMNAYDILVPLIYDPKAQNRLLSQMLDLIVAQMNTLKTSYESGEFPGTDFETDLLEDYSSHIMPTVLDYILRIKNPEFKSEREWRVIRCVFDPDANDGTGTLVYPRNYRITRGILRGYIEHPLHRRELDGPERLPIKTVILGPTSEIHIAASILEECLTAFGYKNISITASQVPIRF